MVIGRYMQRRRNTNPNGNCKADGHTYCKAYSYHDTKTDPDSDCYCHSETNCYSYSKTNGHTNCDCSTHGHQADGSNTVWCAHRRARVNTRANAWLL